MQSFPHKLYHFAYRTVSILCLILAAFLFICGWIFTCYATDMTSQQVLTRIDNPLINLAGLALLLSIFLGICFLLHKNPARGNRILLFLISGWCVLLGIALVLFSKTVPAADAMSVYAAAESLAKGDTSVIHPTDSYLSYYPQQVGLMAFFELLIRLWHMLPIDYPAYHMIKVLYLFLACIIILFQYKTVHLIWEDELADSLYLLFAGANLPFILYTSFVYGEIPSFAAFSVGCFFLLHCLRKTPGKIFSPKGICSLLALTLSVMLRKNSLILIIAVLLILFFEWIRNRKPAILLFGLLCALGALRILPTVQAFYEHRADNHLSDGVPALSYFAMGMQESSRGNGWYNGFNFYTYQESGLDTSATEAQSLNAIRERWDVFTQNPGYMADFYLHKHLSQWADGTYASRQATLATFGGRTAFFTSLYEGDGADIFIEYCNAYQNLLYLGAFLFCIASLSGKKRKENPELTVYLCFVGVVGGFLFHIIWEANSRYIFAYGMLLMPYAARGIALLASNNTFVPAKFRKNNTARTANAPDKQATAL